MIPFVSKHRIATTDGLWTNKMGNIFEPGDPGQTTFYYEGRADIRELGGHLRLFVNDLSVIRRPLVVNEQLKTKLLTEYREDRKKRKLLYKKSSDDEKNPGEDQAVDPTDSDDSSDEEEDEKAEREQHALDRLISEEKKKPLVMPKLSVYLTKKKPKARMVDAHKLGTIIRIPDAAEGEFGFPEKSVSYESPLTDIPDALQYQGLVVLKLPSEEPVTEEPIIYGLVKLQSFRQQRVRTRDALQLSVIAESLAKILVDSNKGDEAGTSTDRTSKRKGAAKKQLDYDDERVGEGTGAGEHVKPLNVYRGMASKVWAHYQKAADEEIDFATCLQFLDYLDLFMVTIQAERIFKAVDLRKDGNIDISEFENMLIAYDILSGYSTNLIVLDTFDTLKSLPVEQIFQDQRNEQQQQQQQQQTTEDGKLTDSSAPAGTDTAAAVGPVTSGDSNKEAGTLSGLEDKNTTKQSTGAKSASKAITRKRQAGLNYNSFCEAVQMLGLKDTDAESQEKQLTEAFCFGGNIKAKVADSKLLNLQEFRSAWLRVASLEEEMKRRNLKFDSGVFAEGRNRERLARALADVEGNYLKTVSKINEVVEKVKQDRRRRKDEKRRAAEAHREKLQHEANKFIAVRAQEKRLKLKREQEEKSKKRLEDKVLRNKLLLRQQENANTRNEDIAKATKEREKLRVEEIRALGYDRLNYSVNNLRAIPTELYAEPDAQLRLSYAKSADFSRNLLDSLPEKDFLYWMSSETRRLKLSQNRLKRIPQDIEHMIKLEILEIDNNWLEILPEGMSQLAALQRLDLSNNRLTALPEELGNCGALRYLSLHSNFLTSLPPSLGACFKLEYLDVSRNLLLELPEGLQYMTSLVHLDINSNRIGNLPHHIGLCRALRYLDASTNALAYIPDSFSALSSLEFCNLDNNDIVTTPNCFNQLTSLKHLSMKTNSARQLFADMGCMHSLTLLDVSVNSVERLPIEMGLMTSLQELRLTRNNLVTLPAELGSCTLLQKLELPYNSIKGRLPETIGLISSLVHLNASFNDINELPRSIVGLQELKTLTMERCALQRFPDTVIYLEKLEVIEVPNNRFTKFPIELNQMKSLKRLNLANNAISLLPRNIDSMSFLEELDLSRNQLRALPVEFTDVLESVAVVALQSNPWTDLPPRWGKLWPGTHATDGPAGYNISDAVDFMYGMRAFYDTAEEIWQELGVFHYTQRLGFEDFLEELRLRIPKTWHEGLVEYVKHVYFESRRSGVFTRWYELDTDIVAEDKARKLADAAKRDLTVVRSKHDLQLRERMAEVAYGGDLHRRARNVLERAAEHERNEQVKSRIALRTLNDNTAAQEELSRQRVERREKGFEKLREVEMGRLQEILSADREDMLEERLLKKKKPRASITLSMLKDCY